MHVQVGTAQTQTPDDLGAAVARRNVQGGLAIPVRHIRRDALLDQVLDDQLGAVDARGRADTVVDGTLAVRVQGGQVALVVVEELDDAEVAPARRHVQARSLRALVLLIYIH